MSSLIMTWLLVKAKVSNKLYSQEHLTILKLFTDVNENHVVVNLILNLEVVTFARA